MSHGMAVADTLTLSTSVRPHTYISDISHWSDKTHPDPTTLDSSTAIPSLISAIYQHRHDPCLAPPDTPAQPAACNETKTNCTIVLFRDESGENIANNTTESASGSTNPDYVYTGRKRRNGDIKMNDVTATPKYHHGGQGCSSAWSLAVQQLPWTPRCLRPKPQALV